jgi:ferredoxin--NADP+ reductase
MKPGDRMSMTTKPIGKFTIDDTLKPDDTRLKILVAAGTGLAPFTSMVEADVAADPKARLDKYVLLHGASYANELGYRERLEQLAREHGLHYLPTVSRPQEAAGWTGDVGRVEDFFAPGRLEALERKIGVEVGTLTPQNSVIYICGLTGTIAMTIERMLPRGFVPFFPKIRRALGWAESVESTIYYEQYDNEPILRIKEPDEVARLLALLPGR